MNIEIYLLIITAALVIAQIIILAQNFKQLKEVHKASDILIKEYILKEEIRQQDIKNLKDASNQSLKRYKEATNEENEQWLKNKWGGNK